MSSTLAVATASSMASSAASASASHGLVSSEGNPAFKIVGICLAIGSGVFIGSSFVVKKKGLLRATAKAGTLAGEGHAYLKSWLWWTGMTMMIVGEVLNFVAYAFTEAILVTPMGALSVVICAILSHFLLKETLNLFGWVGCALCIIGATILALNAPEQQSVTTIAQFKKHFLAPGFLVWGSLCIVASLVVVFWAAPRWGKKNMIPYVMVCSLIGGISVSCTQGLGASIVTSIQGNNQVKNWFFWFLFAFVVVTLLIEINYLNKALELFNAAAVVPFYFCAFTTCVLLSSLILYGFKSSAVNLITIILAFFVMCLGITLLQLSKADPKELSKLDRKATMIFQAVQQPSEASEKGEITAMEEPGMDALRGGFGAVGSIIRARSVSRKLSSASGFPGSGAYDSNLSTHGLGHLQRYQLSDAPMPDDAMERISMHTKSPIDRSTSFHSERMIPSRSQSHLMFEEADVVHQYGYGKNDEAFHHYRQHPHAAPPLSVMTGRAPQMGGRQHSTSSIYPPVVEEPEDLYDPAEKSGGYLDPYSSHLHKSPSSISTTANASSGHRLANLFHFSSSTSPTNQVRGGEHRGTRDYPHLKTRDFELEHEERAGLVSENEHGHGDQDDLGRMSYEDEPRSAVTDESFGHVLRAERRPAPSLDMDRLDPTTPRPGDGFATRR